VLKKWELVGKFDLLLHPASSGAICPGFGFDGPFAGCTLRLSSLSFFLITGSLRTSIRSFRLGLRLECRFNLP
jgi:hypothetical protein